MGARLNVVFHRGNKKQPAAVVYGHWAGDNPGDAAITLKRFFNAVEEQTKDTRYSDPSYPAAKYVVFLSDMFRNSRRVNGEYIKSDQPLDFLSVGVVTTEDSCGPECIAYVDCASIHPATSRPTVTFQREHPEADSILGQKEIYAELPASH